MLKSCIIFVIYTLCITITFEMTLSILCQLHKCSLLPSFEQTTSHRPHPNYTQCLINFCCISDQPLNFTPHRITWQLLPRSSAKPMQYGLTGTKSTKNNLPEHMHVTNAHCSYQHAALGWVQTRQNLPKDNAWT